MNDIVTGEQVADYLRELGTSQGGFSPATLRTVVARDYTLMTLDVRELVKSDPYFEEYVAKQKERDFSADGGFRSTEADEERAPENRYDSPIVVIDGEIVDGYNRAAAHLHDGAPMLQAYVATAAKTESMRLAEAMLENETPKDFLKRHEFELTTKKELLTLRQELAKRLAAGFAPTKVFGTITKLRWHVYQEKLTVLICYEGAEDQYASDLEVRDFRVIMQWPELKGVPLSLGKGYMDMGEAVAVVLEDETPKQFLKRKGLGAPEEPGGQIGYDTWAAYYMPVKNPNPEADDAFDGCCFETYVPDIDRVVAVHRQKPNNVWTLLDADGSTIISPGYHYVNRMIYFITKRPFTSTDVWVDVSIPDDELEPDPN